ncbi:hypothetical protein F4813DRAFT_162093 [Daldinia decipiens]|uniref:uncharacterized protein n=1 Tax=Daldinia decipiens TaxID=326647 RepID=UPI0020C4510C|nr:uncharacterized protein F4813DRAFT_162093 [Daldinia decipiens]KAI1655543.1 hypothetical protein F4813DRAFT_162093 [Daldinia decipiens]
MPPSSPPLSPSSSSTTTTTTATPSSRLRSPPLPASTLQPSVFSQHYQRRQLESISKISTAKSNINHSKILDYNRGLNGVDGDGEGGDGRIIDGRINGSISGTFKSSAVRITGHGPKSEITEATAQVGEAGAVKAGTTTTATVLTLSATSRNQSRLHHSARDSAREPHQNPHPLIRHKHNPPSLPSPPNPPPRTSSLLPPPRSANTRTISLAIPSERSTDSPLNHSRNHSRSHSRSSSTGGASDGFRNLNRWSTSTTSSLASNHNHDHDTPQPQPRPQSQSQSQFQSQKPQQQQKVKEKEKDQQQQHQAIQSPPRKLRRRRPPKDTSASPRIRRPLSPPPPPSSAPPNLPPIISLPPLDANPESVVRTNPPARFIICANSAEPQDNTWNDPTRSNIVAKGNSALLPSAPVIRDIMSERERKSHARGRSSATRGSTDSTRVNRVNKPSQKAMLSKALGKANAAVQLDNAQNYAAARDSYLEACDLLQQVLARTNGEEDRRKLEAIRLTYTSRIEELDELLPTYLQSDKALPARPESADGYHGVQIELAGSEDSAEASGGAKINMGESPPPDASRLRSSPNLNQGQSLLQSSFSGSRMRRNFEGPSLNLPQQDGGFVPAPLSPRRPVSPTKPPTPEPIVRQDFSWPADHLAPENRARSHKRNLSHESGSWLDPIDESGGSASSSIHSRTSSLGVRRKYLRHASSNTEAEFDAALDAAVEAAYDEGFEPMESYDTVYDDNNDSDTVDVLSNARRKVEIAKERVRQTEREAAIELARERERQRQLSIDQKSQVFSGDFFDANDSDEEELVLEEMARRSVMEEFSPKHRSQLSQSRIPRESDSSGTTPRTWHSSVGSNPPTSTTILSTVTEMPLPGAPSKGSAPSLPSPPRSLAQGSPSQNSPTSGVRNRRLSGQNPKQLKIETSKLGQPPSISTSTFQTKTAGGFIAQQRQALSATTTRPGPFSMRAPSSPARGTSPAGATAPPSPPANLTGPNDLEEHRTDSPSSARPGIHKNFSSSSLKSLRTRQFSVSHIDDSDLSPNTPLSHQISNTSISRQAVIPALPTPLAAAFHERMAGGVGGLHLFDSDFHSPTSHSPNQVYHSYHLPHNPDVPIPLEPCPSDTMLRPFWLMRALYQTLAHPRGGYISTRLFIPRDAWKVKGVKLRALEDKIAQCDFLTAALLKLARVDSNDADAVLEEMQSFENILETVQTTLSRKLGNEVGTQGMTPLREDREAEAAPPVPRSASVSGKGGAFSWRRLRNKGSAANMTSAYGGKTNSSGSGGPGVSERDIPSLIGSGSIPSLPLTAHPSSRPAKRDPASVNFDGPYGNYMASLARLFDAAQTVDQIARQVEDPGLRHADKTQVGLELCTRHAAEFFGFYICRFVLADLAMLLDKFVKRGSEWVLN